MSTQLQEKEAVQTEEKKTKKRGGPWLLILLIVFIILFLLTSVVLASRLYERATRDKYSVDLGIGTGGEIELFKISYENASGEITVSGTNGQNVVAPGTQVDYDIRLRNRDDAAIQYVLIPQVTYLTDEAIPLQVKLSDNYGNYLLGSDDQWVSVDALNDITHKGAIHQGELCTYHLSWQWVFEKDEQGDTYDTHLGNSDGAGVEISMLTESTASAAQEKHAFNVMHLLGEGFGCCWCCYLVWILLLVCVLLIVWIWRLRRKLNRHIDTLDEYEEALKKHGLLVNGELVGKL